MLIVTKIRNGEKVLKRNLDRLPQHLTLFQFTPITLVNVERSFYIYYLIIVAYLIKKYQAYTNISSI